MAVDPLTQAETLLKEGKLGEAARLYRAVLAQDPTNVEALNGLANEALMRGSPAVARPLLARAASIEPRNAGTFAALAQVHAMEGRTEEAEVCLATAVALAPDKLEYRIGQAMIRASKGEPTEALENLRAMAQTHPNDAGLQQSIGAMCMAQGDADGAEAAFSRAIQIDPSQPGAWQALGMLHAGTGRAPEAMECLRAALDRAPTNAGVLVALTELLLDQGDAASAERLAREGAMVAPGIPELPCLQGRALLALGKTPEALGLLARTARDAPQSPAPLLVLAETFLSIDEVEKAAACAQAANALPDVQMPVKLSAAGLLLRAGKVSAGWATMAAALPELPDISVPLRLRAPRNLPDALLFVRFCPLVAEAGGTVVLSGAPALAPVLGGVPGLLLDNSEAGPMHGDLLILGACLPREPHEVPPLQHAIPPSRVAAWRSALQTYPGPRIAIAWGGATGLSLDDVLAALPEGASAISIVTGSARAAIAGDSRVIDAGWQVTGYADMAALLLAVDGVLLPDGPAAHLAGALGCSGVVHVPLGGHMAWAAPWYPTVKVLRRWDAEQARAALLPPAA